MLENAFYGLDLLKLHSVTTKLIGRVEKLEEVRGCYGSFSLYFFFFIKDNNIQNEIYSTAPFMALGMFQEGDLLINHHFI